MCTSGSCTWSSGCPSYQQRLCQEPLRFLAVVLGPPGSNRLRLSTEHADARSGVRSRVNRCALGCIGTASAAQLAVDRRLIVLICCLTTVAVFLCATALINLGQTTGEQLCRHRNQQQRPARPTSCWPTIGCLASHLPMSPPVDRDLRLLEKPVVVGPWELDLCLGRGYFSFVLSAQIGRAHV